MHVRRGSAGFALAALLAVVAGCVSTPPTSAPTSPAGTDAVAAAPSVTTDDDPSEVPTTTPSTPEETTSAPPPPVVAGVDAELALATAVELADGVGRRVPGTDGDVAARDVVTRRFAEVGWQVTADPLPLPQGGETANLVATVDGTVPSGPMVVVGSHLDTLGGVGANDNASGVGVLVAVASELADEAAGLGVPVVLVAFAAEERQDAPGRPNHLGSGQLAAAWADRTVAMLSVDMVGNGPTTRIVGLEGTDDTLVRRVADVAVRNGIGDVVTDTRGDISDHGPFALRGVPAAFLWTGPDDRLHTDADTTDHLDVEDLRRAGDLVLAWLRDLTTDDLAGLRASVSD